MRFGTYFAYWEKSWSADYFKYIDKVKALGFDVLEVTADIMELSDEQLAALRKKSEDTGVKLTACIGLPAKYDVSNEDEAVRRGGIEYLKKMLDAMSKAGIDRLGGIIYAYWPCDYSKPVDKPAVRKRSMESVRELAAYAAQYGIHLELEIVNRFEQFLLNDAKEAVEYIDELGCDNVHIMLDSFHMNIEEDNMGDAIRRAGHRLGHFHIGECNRKVPGKGHMPWDEIGQALRDIGYDGCVVMEPFTRMGGIVGSDIKVWRDLSENADDEQFDRDIAESLVFVKKAFEGK